MGDLLAGRRRRQLDRHAMDARSPLDQGPAARAARRACIISLLGVHFRRAMGIRWRHVWLDDALLGLESRNGCGPRLYRDLWDAGAAGLSRPIRSTALAALGNRDSYRSGGLRPGNCSCWSRGHLQGERTLQQAEAGQRPRV